MHAAASCRSAKRRPGSTRRRAPVDDERPNRDELLRRARARAEHEWRLCEFDLGRFIPRVTPAYTTPEHLREVLDVLDESMRRPIIALIEAPPRHGKTDTILHHIARYLAFRPDQQVAYCSYSAEMARRKSRKTREVAARAGLWAREVEGNRGSSAAGTAAHFDPSQAVAFWQTLYGGGLISGGRNGGFVGEGFGQIVIDDPFKNRSEAESSTIQAEVCEACFEGTLFTRRAPGASVIVTHQPWNDRDLSAYLDAKFRREGVEIIRVTLPAVRDAEFDGDGKLLDGTPLWDRFGVDDLRLIQIAVNDYNFDSQYLCKRSPKGARVFIEPQRYVRPKRDGATMLVSCDPGISEKRDKDPSAFVEVAAYRDELGLVCLDILEAVELNLQIPATVDELEERAERRGGAAVLVEEVSAFRGVSQMARRLDDERVRRGESPARLRISSIVPKDSKLVRAQPTAAAVRFGRIRVPLAAPWLPKFLEQLTRFTGRPGGRDNMVDALTQVYDWACLHLSESHEVPETGEARAMASGF